MMTIAGAAVGADVALPPGVGGEALLPGGGAGGAGGRGRPHTLHRPGLGGSP